MTCSREASLEKLIEKLLWCSCYRGAALEDVLCRSCSGGAALVELL